MKYSSSVFSFSSPNFEKLALTVFDNTLITVDLPIPFLPIIPVILPSCRIGRSKILNPLVPYWWIGSLFFKSGIAKFYTGALLTTFIENVEL